jgi:hypothetical protein
MEYPYLLLEQAGLFMIIVWNTLALVGSRFIYYAMALGFSQVLGLLDYKRIRLVFTSAKTLPRNVP